MIERQIDLIGAALAREFDARAVEAAQIAGGNNIVFKLRCETGRAFIAKIYPASAEDRRDRLGAEFGALSFLWRHGVRAVPEPLFMDRGAGFAIYQNIEGEKISGGRIGGGDLEQAAEFMRELHALGRLRESDLLPAASEPCFTCSDYVRIIDRRLRVFENDLGDGAPLHREARRFLSAQFVPAFESFRRWHSKRLEELGMDGGGELGRSGRTLSPSDFGFHNAIKREDGKVVFIDFEYFGWDDPAKLIADFLHHPGSSLVCEKRAGFLERAQSIFEDSVDLDRRIQLAMPATGLKWCLILLKEFLPQSLERRRLARGWASEEEILSIQLQRAREKLRECEEGQSVMMC